jgi:hypothetical protein
MQNTKGRANRSRAAENSGRPPEYTGADTGAHNENARSSLFQALGLKKTAVPHSALTGSAAEITIPTVSALYQTTPKAAASNAAFIQPAADSFEARVRQRAEYAQERASTQRFGHKPPSAHNTPTAGGARQFFPDREPEKDSYAPPHRDHHEASTNHASKRGGRAPAGSEQEQSYYKPPKARSAREDRSEESVPPQNYRGSHAGRDSSEGHEDVNAGRHQQHRGQKTGHPGGFAAEQIEFAANKTRSRDPTHQRNDAAGERTAKPSSAEAAKPAAAAANDGNTDDAKPVPMLLQILAAAKAKRDQQRAAEAKPPSSGTLRVPSSGASVASNSNSTNSDGGRRPSAGSALAPGDTSDPAADHDHRSSGQKGSREPQGQKPRQQSESRPAKGTQRNGRTADMAHIAGVCSPPSQPAVSTRTETVAASTRVNDSAAPGAPVVSAQQEETGAFSAYRTSTLTTVDPQATGAPRSAGGITSAGRSANPVSFSAAHALLYRTSNPRHTPGRVQRDDDCASEASDDSLFREVSRYTTEAPLTPGDFAYSSSDVSSEAQASAADNQFTAHLTRAFSSAPTVPQDTTLSATFRTLEGPLAPSAAVGAASLGATPRIRQPFSPFDEAVVDTRTTVSLASLSSRSPTLSLPPGTFPSFDVGGSTKSAAGVAACDSVSDKSSLSGTAADTTQRAETSSAPGSTTAPGSGSDTKHAPSGDVGANRSNSSKATPLSLPIVSGPGLTVDTSLTPPPTPSRSLAPAAPVPSLPVSVPISDALPSPQPSPQAQAALPVDAHRERILQHVRQYPVTIINGMTGCGKSTRIPVMLLEDSRENGTPENRAEDSTEDRVRGGARDNDAYIMVSQPRRIAATALKNRLAQTLGDAVGLRLGKGRREEVSTYVVCGVVPGSLMLCSAVVSSPCLKRWCDGFIFVPLRSNVPSCTCAFSECIVFRVLIVGRRCHMIKSQFLWPVICCSCLFCP